LDPLASLDPLDTLARLALLVSVVWTVA